MNEQVTQPDDIFAQNLELFHQLVEQEINLITQGTKIIKKQEMNGEVAKLKTQLEPVIQSISTTGDASQYKWIHLRSLIVFKMRETLNFMQMNYPFVKQQGQSEGFEDELDIILQFLCSFEQKAPFTIQRICELLQSPEKHYKSSKKLLFAMEKLVNVSAL